MRISTKDASKVLGLSVLTIQYDAQQGTSPYARYIKRTGCTRGMYDIQSSKLADYLKISEKELLERIGVKDGIE